MSFVWFVFLGATYAARLAAHNRVTFQFKLFPKIVGDISTIFSDLVWIAFNCTMIYYSIIVIQDGFKYPEYSPDPRLDHGLCFYDLSHCIFPDDHTDHSGQYNEICS